MAKDMAKIKNIGIDIDLNTSKIIINTAKVDNKFTLLKSLSAILIKSLVKTPSPVTIAVLSYFFTISSIFSI